MSNIFLIFSFILSVGIAVALKDYYKSAASGKTWWQALIIYAALTAGLFLILAAVPVILTVVVRLVGAQSGIAQILLMIAIAGATLGYLHHLVMKRFSGMPSLVNHGVNLAVIIYFISVVVDMGVKVFGSTQLVFWQTHALIMVLACYLGYQLIKYWEAEGREIWGVAITYVLDCIMLSVLGAFIGNSVIGSMEGSLFFFIPLLGFNLLIFWFFFGFGDPKSKKKLSRAVVTLFTLGLLGIYGGLLYLQVTGNLTQVEAWAAAQYNRYQQAQTKIDRKVAYVESGAKEASQKAEHYQDLARKELAKPNPDIDLVKQYQGLAETFGKKVKAGYESQKGMDRPENVLPEKVEKMKDDVLSVPEKIGNKIGNIFSSDSNSNSNQRSRGKIVSIAEPGTFYFTLEPFEKMGNWLFIEEGLNYRVSASKNTYHTFYVKYKDDGVYKLDRDGVSLPKYGGPLKFIGHEKKVTVILLVTS